MTELELAAEAKIDVILESYDNESASGSALSIGEVDYILPLDTDVIIEIMGLTIASSSWPDGVPVITYTLVLAETLEQVVIPVGKAEVSAIFSSSFMYLYTLKSKKNQLINAVKSAETIEQISVINW